MTCKRGRTGTVSGMLFFAARWAAEMPILRYVHILLMRSASAACLSIYCVCVIIGRTCGAIATYRSYVASDSAHLDASSQCRIGAPRLVASLHPSDRRVIVATEKRLFQSWRRCLRTVKRRGGPYADDGLCWKDLCSSLFVRDFPLIASVSLVWWLARAHRRATSLRRSCKTSCGQLRSPRSPRACWASRRPS